MDTVTISPEDPTNDDTLTCNATASDADGDDPIISYLWSSGYTEVEWTLTSATSPGDILTCTATATDASGASATDTASVTVSNRPPTIASVTIEPDAPRASDEVTCTATGAADPDGEDVTVGYTWDINDAPAGTGTTLSSGYSKGDDLTCTVTATDDFGASTTATASVTVDNTRPDVSDIVLTPSELFTNDTLTATPTVSDADGDDLTVTYAFSVDGDVVQDSESASLSGATYFDKSDTVSVIVTASDGVGFDTRSSDTLTVLNTAPEAPEVSVLLYERNGVESVSGGGMHTCSVTTAGIAQCWGNDGYDGQSTPPADTFESLSAGYAHNCGLTTSGNTECWGFDSHGQSTPPATTFESISAGGFHTCGVTSTGDLDCWGVSEGETGWDYGQVTDTSDGTFESVGAGYIHTCAITTTGNIACWGKDDFDQASPPAGTFVSMSVGYFHACGFNTSGSVVCWGFDAYGQSSPPAGTFASVSAGHSHTCGITSAGSIECWGSDTYGQSSPPAGTFVSLNAGHHHSCAVTSEGGVACWGMDGDGRVSDIPEFDPVDGLTCTIDEESTDADGDSISYTFDWDVDGDEFTDTDSTTYDGDTVPGDSLSDGGLWTCEVTPNDGEADGEFGSAEYENPCDGTEIDCPAASCQAILDDNPAAEDGNYWIDLGDGTSFETMCEMSTHGGGWTLIAQGVPTYDPSDYSGIYEQWNNNSAFNIEGWLGSDLSSFHTANTQIDHLAVHDEMFVQCSATGSCGWGGSSCGWDGTSYLITGMGDFNWDWETSATSCTDSTGITYSTTWAPSAHFGPSCAGGMTLGHWPAGSSYPWYCDNFGHNLRAWVR
jgi:hypothetical protein